MLGTPPPTNGFFVSETIWTVTTVAWLLALYVVIARFEFDLRFESLFHRLRPDDLRDKAYVICFGDLLNHGRLMQSRRFYLLLSFGLLIIPTLVSSYSADTLRPLAKIICPEDLGVWLNEKVFPVEHLFRHLLFWGVGFHFFPVISVVSAARSRAKEDGDDKGNAAITLLSVVFLIQQYVLDMTIGHLLRCKLNPSVGRPIRRGYGSIIHLAKSRIAETMRLTTPVDIVRREYGLVTESMISGLGIGAAAVQGRTLSPPDERSMIVRMIERLGIPDVRQRLEWRLSRRTQRQTFRAEVRAEVVVADGVSIDLGTAWLEDIGSSNLRGKWNSFLLRLHDDSNRNAIELHKTIRIQTLNGKPVGRRPILSLVQRVSPANVETGGRLYVGAVIQMTQVNQFNRVIKRTRYVPEEV